MRQPQARILHILQKGKLWFGAGRVEQSPAEADPPPSPWLPAAVVDVVSCVQPAEDITTCL